MEHQERLLAYTFRIEPLLRRLVAVGFIVAAAYIGGQLAWHSFSHSPVFSIVTFAVVVGIGVLIGTPNRAPDLDVFLEPLGDGRARLVVERVDGGHWYQSFTLPARVTTEYDGNEAGGSWSVLLVAAGRDPVEIPWIAGGRSSEAADGINDALMKLVKKAGGDPGSAAP
jgi:hypothetical protein